MSTLDNYTKLEKIGEGPYLASLKGAYLAILGEPD